jgi:hypothetical protein
MAFSGQVDACSASSSKWLSARGLRQRKSLKRYESKRTPKLKLDQGLDLIIVTVAFMTTAPQLLSRARFKRAVSACPTLGQKETR